MSTFNKALVVIWTLLLSVQAFATVDHDRSCLSFALKIMRKPQHITIRSMEFDPRMLMRAGELNQNSENLQLIRLTDFEALPLGTVLYSVSGSRLVVGIDHFSVEIRHGFVMFGFLQSQIDEANRELFLAVRNIDFNEHSLFRVGELNRNSEDLYLITADDLETLPRGTVLYSVNGRRRVVGVDHIPLDERHGFLSTGFLRSQIEEAQAEVFAAIRSLEFNPQMLMRAGELQQNRESLQLISSDDLSHLPTGTALYSIGGRRYVTGIDRLPIDERHGYLSLGFLESQINAARRSR